MKNIFIVLIIAGAVYSFYKPVDAMDVLLDSAKSSKISSLSGIEILKSQGGSGFDVNKLAVPGQVTVVEFYAAWCPTCKKLNKIYQRFVKVRPDVAIRRVKMKDKWNAAWAKKQFSLDITGTPHVLVFDEKGNVITQDVGNNKQAYHMLYQWMNDELRNS